MKFAGESAHTFRSRLWYEQKENPFVLLDSRTNAERVLHVARDCGFVAVRKKGEVSVDGVGYDSLVWVDVEGHPVDPTFPMRNQGFREAMRHYVGGHLGDEELKQIVQEAAFEEFILEPGEVPLDPPVKYLGSVVLADRKAYL